MTYQVLHLPLFGPKGEILSVTPDAWDVRPDYWNGVLQLSSGRIEHALPLQSVLAIEGSEQEARALGKTIGRMALTGVATAFLSKGRRGGMGAGLLDLSVRGVETKSIITGTIVFQDMSVLKYSVSAKNFKQLASKIPQVAFSDEAAKQPKLLFDLIDRMKKDGRRAVDELVQHIITLNDQIKNLHTEAEVGDSFVVRDQARQLAEALEGTLSREKLVLKALLFAHGLSFSDLISDTPSSGDSLASMFGLLSHGPVEAQSTPASAAYSDPPPILKPSLLEAWQEIWVKQSANTKLSALSGTAVIVILILKHYFW